MLDLMTVVATGMREQMLAYPTLAALVVKPDGQYKVFFEEAEGLSDVPYIRMSHIWGGDLNNAPSQAFDMTYSVSAVAKTSPAARALLGHIRSALWRQKLPYPDGWVDWAGCTITGHSKNILTAQGVQYWDLGMFVRVRGTKSA